MRSDELTMRIMTRAEFAKAVADLNKGDKWFWGTWLAAFFFILFANIPLADRVPEHFEIPYLIGFFTFLIGNLFLIIRISKSRAIRAGLMCHLCGATFTKTGIEMAITTGNCASCSQKFLSD